MRTIARCFLLFGLVAAVPRVAAAQAILAGEVKDTTGAVLPGTLALRSGNSVSQARPTRRLDDNHDHAGDDVLAVTEAGFVPTGIGDLNSHCTRVRFTREVVTLVPRAA